MVNDLDCSRDGTGSSIAVADGTVQAIRSFNGIAIANYGSVTTKEDPESVLLQLAFEQFGSLDILANNAGITRYTRSCEMRIG